MDQIRIGQFIAQTRRSRGLTQKQLAQLLSISDKTVSKWECGKGLPEVSLMLPLCRALEITVNDLLAGHRVDQGEYQKTAEENMMDLMRENEENRKKLALSAICGGMTVLAVCSLVVIASFMELPAAARVVLVLLAIAAAVVGIGGAAVLDVGAGYYQCPHCGTLFVPTMTAYVKGYHTITRRRLTCPECGVTSMCRRRITR